MIRTDLPRRPSLPNGLLLLCTVALLIGCQKNASQPSQPQPSVQQPSVTRATLDESLEKGRQYLLGIQRDEGNFQYELNLRTGQINGKDNQVRQAGTLWSVALLHQHRPDDDTRSALAAGIDFFDKHSKTNQGRKFIVYPNSKSTSTGTIALVTLSLIELLRTEPELDQAERYREQMDQYIAQLLWLRRDDGRFRRSYDTLSGEGTGASSPYYDGETLLALAKACNYLDRDDLKETILQSAETMFQTYFAAPRRADEDKLPKQFYQWGSMAFLEIYNSGWEEGRPYAGRAIEMGHWLIGQMGEGPSKYNKSYAFEGLISAWELARLHGDQAALEIFGRRIERGMLNLLSWQIGGPIPNSHLPPDQPIDPRAIGAVVSNAENPWLRIDYTQHQMHATILARRYVFLQ